MCPAGAEKRHGLMDGDQEAESGDLATDFHAGSKSLSDLGKLSQPSHGETGALGLTPLTACPPTISWEVLPTGMGSLLVQGDKGGEAWASPKKGNPALFLISLSTSQDDRQAFGDRIVLVSFPDL